MIAGESIEMAIGLGIWQHFQQFPNFAFKFCAKKSFLKYKNCGISFNYSTRLSEIRHIQLLIKRNASMLGMDELLPNLLEPEVSKKREPKSGKNKKKKWKGEEKRQAPNYFVATRVSDTQIISQVERVQDAIVEKEPNLSLAKIPTATLHITLAVMCLKTDEDLAKASSAMDLCEEKLKDFEESPHIEYHGLGHFHHNVLFVKIRDDPAAQRLQFVADTVRECFESVGLIDEDNKQFSPHLTIMKTSKARLLWKQRLNKIDSSYYTEYIDVAFGKEQLHDLQLLSMGLDKDEDGYYRCKCQARLGKNRIAATVS